MSDREKKGAFPTREDWERANRVDDPLPAASEWERANHLCFDDEESVLDWYRRRCTFLEQELESTKKELERTKDELNSNLCKFSLTQKELEWHKSLAITRSKYKSRLDMTQEELHTTKEELDMTKQELHKIQEEMTPTLSTLTGSNLEWAINILRVNDYLASRSSEDDEGRGER